MSTNVHIDQYISSSLDKAEWNYEDIYWEAAEKLIIEAEKKKKKRFLFWFLLLLLVFNILIFLLGIAGTIHLINTYADKDLKPDSTNIINSNTHKKVIPISNLIAQNKSIDTKSDNKKYHSNKSNSYPKAKLKKSRKYKSIIKKENTFNSNSLINENHTKPNDSIVQDLHLMNTIGFNLYSPNNLDLYADEGLEDIIRKKHQYFIGINTGINYNIFSSNINPGYFIGAYYQNNFKKKWSIRASIDYVKVNQQTLISIISTRDYDFGTFTNKTNVSVKSIQYLQVPFTLHYRFYKHHSVHAGLTTSFYLNQTNEYNEYNKSDLIKEYTITGFGNDIQKYDVSIRLGYENILFKRLPIGVSVNYGLVDQYKSDSIKSNNFDVRLYLFYNLFK